MLFNLDGDAWVLLSDGEWVNEAVNVAFVVTLTMIANLELRLVRPFRFWPWPLRYFCNGTPAQQRGVVAALSQTCDHCTDAGLTERVLAADGGAVRKNTSVLLDPAHPKRKMIEQSMAVTPATNIGNEDRFARAGNMSTLRAGRWINSTTVCASHVISELASHWSVAVSKFKPPTMAGAVLLTTALTSPWMYFFAKIRRAHPAWPMRCIGAAWRQLDGTERRRQTAMWQQHLADEESFKHCDNVRPRDTPLGIGCTTWPVREEYVGKMCDEGCVASDSARWCNTYGGILRASADSVEKDYALPQRRKQCGERFGPDACADDISAVVQDNHATVTELLNLLARDSRAMTRFRLYRFRSARPAGAHQAVPEFLVPRAKNRGWPRVEGRLGEWEWKGGGLGW